MLPHELEAYLHERIPLSRAMAVEIVRADPDAVVVRAPLAPNTNHSQTVFGGSAAAVAVLAAWSMVDVRLRAEAVDARVVIRRSTMDFERPIVAGFTATATPPAREHWDRLRATLARGRMARATVTAVLECEGARVGSFEGEFAVTPA